MPNLNYSNFIFFNENHKNDNDNENETKKTIEGIANFCALNRSHNNQRADLWKNLGSRLDKARRFKYDSNNANKTNDRIFNMNIPRNHTGAIFNEDGDKAMEYGKIHIYSSDFKKYFGIKPVDADGVFRALTPELIANPDKYVFAYQDSGGRYWKTVFNKDGEITREGVQSGQTPADTADLHGRITNQELTSQVVAGAAAAGAAGGAGAVAGGRDDNGKIVNTELKNSGAELRYNAMKLIYAESVTNTIVLSVGIIASLFFIAKNR